MCPESPSTFRVRLRGILSTVRYWVRNLEQAAFELWQIRLDGGQFSDALVGSMSVGFIACCGRERAQAIAMKRFGVPLPEDFVPSE